MMIGSRLRQRRTTKTITVKSKTLSAGQYSESNALTGLTATHDPGGGDEQIAPEGEFVVVTDVFWFEPTTPGGSLPGITAAHVLVDENSVRYEVVANTIDQANGGSRLKVMTRRVTTT